MAPTFIFLSNYGVHGFQIRPLICLGASIRHLRRAPHALTALQAPIRVNAYESRHYLLLLIEPSSRNSMLRISRSLSLWEILTLRPRLLAKSPTRHPPPWRASA